MSWNHDRVADLRRRLQQAQSRVEWIERACQSHRAAAEQGDVAAQRTLAKYQEDRLVSENDVAWLTHELRQAEAAA